jgi:hypothetical protein
VSRGALARLVGCALLLTGCLHTDEAKDRTRSPTQSAPPQQQVGTPAEVLKAFVEAAGENPRAMWSMLSHRTRNSFGGSFTRFRDRRAHEVEETVAALSLVESTVLLQQRITGTWAVAALAGEQIVEGRSVHLAYAAALRFEGRAWKIELTNRVLIEPLRPEPGERLARRTQLAAQIDAARPIEEAGLWLDGDALRTRGGGTSSHSQTMFAESGRLATGPHFVIAFASAGNDAAALAWTFRAGTLGDPLEA